MAVVAPVDLDELKQLLHVDLADTSLDDQLTSVLARAAEGVENAVGPMTPREQTSTVRTFGSDGGFVLPEWPVLDIDDVVVISMTDHYTGDAIDVATLDVDAEVGYVNGLSWSPSQWPSYDVAGVGVRCPVRVAYDVTYNVGRNPVPGPLCEATLVVAEQLWTARRPMGDAGRFTQSGIGSPDKVPVYRGYAWPNRATQLVAPYLKHGVR